MLDVTPSGTRLRADRLACRRGGRLVFAGLSFRLDAGGALVLTGPNGSGKSSLLRLVAGLIPACTGTVTWAGAPGAIAYLGHQDAVKPTLTTHETLRFWGATAGAKPRRPAIEAALASVDLEGLDNVPCRYLSAGQRRRLALARIKLVDAELWLLDEPTLGLDTVSVARLEAHIADHRTKGGIVVLATHVPLALEATSRLALEDFSTVGSLL